LNMGQSILSEWVTPFRIEYCTLSKCLLEWSERESR